MLNNNTLSFKRSHIRYFILPALLIKTTMNCVGRARKTIAIATLWLLLLQPNASQAENPVAASCNIRLAGDSTMQIVDPERSPDFGWGQLLVELVPKSTRIFNYAKGGRSTKTFLLESRWQQLMEETRPEDWVLIQFGHNDASYEKAERYTAPVDFESNLRKFVLDTRKNNAHPVLITPVVRRHFDHNGKLRDIHGIYPSLVRKVSIEMNVPLIDLFKRSSEEILQLGVLGSIDLFVHIGPGVHKCCPEGRIDNTHFTRKGALRMANLVIDEIKSIGPSQLAHCFINKLD